MLCIPALIYLVYTIIYILIDVKNNQYNNMIIKIWIGILVFALLYVLCSNDLTIIAWFIVSIPFIYMILVLAILLYVVKVDPTTGISTTTQSTTSTSQPTTTSTTTASTTSTSQPTTTSTTTSQPNTTQSSPTIIVTPTTFGIGL